MSKKKLEKKMESDRRNFSKLYSRRVSEIEKSRISKLQKDEKRFKKLIKAQSDYIKLLGEELNEVVGIASVHGWKSSRYEQGIKCREKIKNAKKRKLN